MNDDNQPRFGFVNFAETWNGRMAMMGILIGLGTELITGQSILRQIGIGQIYSISSAFTSIVLSLDERVIDLICNKSPEWSQKKVRTFLGGFGFQNETVFKYIKQLSGGEKARLALALMIMDPSNFLLLDEPTNHLDLQSKENLELAINNYKGTLLIISHDRYFISKVANRIVEIKDSKLFSYDGNYEYFLEKK